LWLCDDGYPLDLQDQVLPIIDLMAVNSAHFARLRNFIQLQLPAGFPVKIEIPLFHLVSARITFSAINKPGPHVSLADASNKVEIDAAAFEIPQHYRMEDSYLYGLQLNEDAPSRSTITNGNITSRQCNIFLNTVTKIKGGAVHTLSRTEE
uniref:SHR-BD domain-containing protein n=1 Tax=Gongylonema pulchrum TaxID=637853 RepID=A0A183ERV0_9BILA